MPSDNSGSEGSDDDELSDDSGFEESHEDQQAKANGVSSFPFCFTTKSQSNIVFLLPP